jgi:hypothetical protein
MGWELVGFFGVEGLDTRICWGFWGWWSEKKGPGLKPRDSMRLIQGAEAPCSLRKDKNRSFSATMKTAALCGRTRAKEEHRQRNGWRVCGEKGVEG